MAKAYICDSCGKLTDRENTVIVSMTMTTNGVAPRSSMEQFDLCTECHSALCAMLHIEEYDHVD